MHNNTKRTLSRVNLYVYAILVIGIIALAWWGISQYKKARSVQTNMETQYNRAFHELADYVDDIQVSLDKSMLVSSPAQMSTISSDLLRKSSAAKECLAQLPLAEIELDKTSNFLSQVGDYTYVLSQNMINEQKLSDEAYKNLESLSKYATDLNVSLSKIEQDFYDGNINFDNPSAKKHLSNNVKAAENDILSNIEGIEKQFKDYPSLIYDGPFSEHIQTSKAVMLENAPEMTQDDALKKAKEFLGERGNDIAFEYESQNSTIEAYSFSSNKDNRQINISISKKGGYVVYFLDNRSVSQESIDFNKATQLAKEFLASKGYTSLKNSYYVKGNSIATINFSYVQDGITCYSDLLKVRVALDDGEILGIEASGYIMNHKQRDFAKPKLTKEQARSIINKNLDIIDTNLVIIPKDSLKEVLCYEFAGSFNNKNFIIYINADNGNEEKILMLLESEDGILTM